MSPTITVLIPTKNRRVLLERALMSIFSQSVIPEEIIVINDGSNDETDIFLDTIKNTHANLKVIHREKSGGVNTARNQGIKRTSSEWIAFLDDDDEFSSEAISVMKEKISTLPPNFFVAYFNSNIIRGDDAFVGGFQFQNIEGKKDFYDPSHEETMEKWNLRGDCKQVIRKDLFLENKYLFPESVNGFESYTMNLISRDNKKIRYFKEELTVIHQEPYLQDRLSITASKKNPWPLFLLHTKQIFEHFKYYLSHPILFGRKTVIILKLLTTSFLKLFRMN